MDGRLRANQLEMSLEDYEALNPVTLVDYDGGQIIYCTPTLSTKWRADGAYHNEPRTLEWIAEFPADDMLFDIGADVGMYTMWAALTRGAKVYAFEPESQNYAVLCKNILYNGAQESVTAYCLAISNGLLMMGHCTAREAAAFFAKIGGMTPSVSTLQRLTRTMHERWETLGPETLDSIRDAEGVPHEAVSASVSLDGVMVPLRAGEDGRAEASWREAACGTVSFHDARGERLKTLYLGRMPESGKVTLKAQLASEVAHIRQLRPDVRIVAIADGAADNWTFLETLSPETEVIGFWHACEHLRTASDHAVASDWFERYREVLRHDPCGVDKVIRALRHFRDSAKPDRAEIERELAFFRKHRQRMRYHALKAEGVAIGSGVVEAANKTLVTQRMKRSGMRWRIAGAQAVLTFRALIKFARFDRAWKAIIGATDTPANDNINPCAVIAIAA